MFSNGLVIFALILTILLFIAVILLIFFQIYISKKVQDKTAEYDKQRGPVKPPPKISKQYGIPENHVDDVREKARQTVQRIRDKHAKEEKEAELFKPPARSAYEKMDDKKLLFRSVYLHSD